MFSLVSSQDDSGKASIVRHILQMQKLSLREMCRSAPSHMASYWLRNDDNQVSSVIFVFGTLGFIKYQEVTCTESIITCNQAKVNERVHQDFFQFDERY